MTAYPLSVPDAPARSKIRRYFIDPIVAQLTQGITPEKIALTLAVGSACALFPVLGTTTLLCLFVGIFLRLNQPLIQMVNAFCILPHIFVIWALFRLGAILFGVHPQPWTVAEYYHRVHPHFVDLIRMIWSDSNQMFRRIELAIVHAIVAWVILAPFWVAGVYLVSLPLVRFLARMRRETLQACAEKSAENDISGNPS